MDTVLWAKVHGATTHFPIALGFCSGALDVMAFSLRSDPRATSLQAAAYWTLLLGAAGSVPAVVSGLFMTQGSVLGHGALRSHHLFVWPAFALLIALATWRGLVGSQASRPLIARYLLAMGVATALMGAASFWGGEMMIAG